MMIWRFAKQRYALHASQSCVDLGYYSGQSQHNFAKNQGLRTLAANLFGWRISKVAMFKTGAARNLSPRQIAYAATDAWIVPG